MLRYLLIGFVVLVVGIQFVPVDRSNPPVTAEIKVPAEVKAVLQTACYDCHSNETVWPWYSYIAPISWQVAGHVDHGRGNLNFSEWGLLSEGERKKMRNEIWEEVEQGDMPLSDYLRMHKDARLSQDELVILNTWASRLGAYTQSEDY